MMKVNQNEIRQENEKRIKNDIEMLFDNEKNA